MKKSAFVYWFILVFGLFVSLSGVQAQDCGRSLSEDAFQKGLSRIAAQGDDQHKLDRAMEMMRWGCFSAAQVKTVALLFAGDLSRLQFTQAVFQRTLDPDNFYDVYDAFRSISFALRLYDYTHNPQPAPVVQGERREDDQYPSRSRREYSVKSDVPSFEALPYPSAAGYTGKKGCDGPIADNATFNALASHVREQPSDEAKYVAIQSGVQNNCLSLEQLMELTTLVSADPLRFRMMNETLLKAYDVEHFASARALFHTPDLQNQWMNSAQQLLIPPPPPCFVSDGDLRDVIRSLQSRNFPTEKLAQLDAVRSNRCFSVAQISVIAREFPFEKDKVAAMKKLYDRCSDKPNYYQLADQLKFSYMKDDLNQFIQQQK